MTRAALVTATWGPTFEATTRELDKYVCHLREKLEPEPDRPRFLRTERGVGYGYYPPEPSEA